MTNNSKTSRQYKLEEILSEEEINHAVRRIFEDKNVITKSWKLMQSEVKTAADHALGYFGDHFKVTLSLKCDDDKVFETHLFIKTLPLSDKSKAEMIKGSNLFTREMIMFKIFEDINSGCGK